MKNSLWVITGALTLAMLTSPPALIPGPNQTRASTERGQGPDEWLCLGCVAAGTFALFGGAIAWAAVASGGAASLGVGVACVTACQSAIREM